MENFVYRGRDRSGRVVKGSIVATNLKDAQSKLKMMGIRVLSCRPGAARPTWKLIQKDDKGNYTINLKPPSVSAVELAVFTRQLSVMINSGLSVVQSFQMLASQTDNLHFREVLDSVRVNVESGVDFSVALAKYPHVFNNLYVALVKAGTDSGQLDEMLQRLSVYVEKNNRLIGQLKSAMTYPVLVVVLAIGLTILMLTFVVPAFAESFAEAGQSLPFLTQMVVDASEWMRQYIVHVLVGIVVVVQLFIAWKNSVGGRRIWHRFLLKVPIFSPVILKIAVARLSRTLGTLTGSGISILDALQTCAKAAGNVILEDAIMKVRSETEKGKGLASPMKQQPHFFPLLMTGMIEIGEASGQLDKMLGKVADFYEEEVDQAIAGMLKLIEPLMFVVIGGIVGIILIAMYLPIFSMAANF